MIQLPDPTELAQLQNFAEPFCVTMYAPAIEVDPNGATNPNKIELKNLLSQAEVALLNDGVDERIVGKTLRPARALLDSPDFWSRHSESLALFMHPALFRSYRLPEDVPYIVTIARGFNLQPLQDILGQNRPYLLLALSHKNVRMYQGDRFQLRPLQLKNFPTNMKQTLNIDEYPKAWETHTIAPTGGGKGSEAFHGQYNVSQTNKEMLFLFFRKIDSALRKFLQEKDMPLILAGVEYLLPIYRQANTSPYLVNEGIRGNVEHENLDELREHAWSLLRREGFA